VVQDWGNFAVITGSAAGALTGLLFVAVSLNRERIAGHPGLRGQAGQTLVLFMLPLLLSVLLVLPGWSAVVLGAALIVLAVVAATVLALIGREKRPGGDGTEDRLALLLDKASPNLATVVLILVAGCLQCAGDGGLYWAAASSVLSLVSGVVNAWLFLTRS
jgi:modulator of FtsH protease